MRSAFAFLLFSTTALAGTNVLHPEPDSSPSSFAAWAAIIGFCILIAGSSKSSPFHELANDHPAIFVIISFILGGVVSGALH